MIQIPESLYWGKLWDEFCIHWYETGMALENRNMEQEFEKYVGKWCGTEYEVV